MQQQTEIQNINDFRFQTITMDPRLEKFANSPNLVYYTMAHRIQSDGKTKEDLLWMITPKFTILAKTSGDIRRVIRNKDIGVIYVQHFNGVPRWIIKSQVQAKEKTLVLEIRSHLHNSCPIKVAQDPDIIARIYNACYKTWTGKDLPAYRIGIDYNVYKEPSKYGPFQVQDRRTLKEKQKQWLNDNDKPFEFPKPEPPPPPPPPVIEEPSPVVEEIEEEEEEEEEVFEEEPEEPEVEFVEYIPPEPPAPPPPPVQPAEPMMLIPIDMLNTLQQPAPTVRRKRKPKELPGAPQIGRNKSIQSVNLHLYMHHPTHISGNPGQRKSYVGSPNTMGINIGNANYATTPVGTAPAAGLSVDNELPAASPLAYTHNEVGASYLPSPFRV